MPIPLFILRRILAAIPTLLVISFLGFFLMRFNFTLGPIDFYLGQQHWHVMDPITMKNPIDPLAEINNNPQISEAAKLKEKQRLGLDKPMLVQYGRWLTNATGIHPQVLWCEKAQPECRELSLFTPPDLGITYRNERVTDVLQQRAGNTLLLNLVALLFSWLAAIPLGIYAALHWRSITDRFMTIFSAVGMSFPSFVLALLLALFAVKTGWFPLGGLRSENFASLNPFRQVLDVAHHLVLPSIILVIGSISSIQRQMRGNLLDVLEAEYVRTARAKGLPEKTVIYKHAVRTAINPLVTMMGYEFSGLLGGAILIETILQYPGLGQLTYKAAVEGDTNMVMASLILAAFMLVLGNLLADIVLKLVDPRIELE